MRSRSVLHFKGIKDEFQEEIRIVEAALSRPQDEDPPT
jgi:hypothetical protein